MDIAQLKYIISYDRDKRPLIAGSALIVVISSVFAAILGFKALLIPMALALIWAAFKSQLNLIWIYLAVQPILFLISYTLANVSGYALAMILILGWITMKLMYGFDGKDFSKPLLVITAVYLLLVMVSDLSAGINRGSVYIFIRVLIIFSFSIVFYDIFRPKYVFMFFIAFTIPLLVNSFIMLKILGSDWFEQVYGFPVIIQAKSRGIIPASKSRGLFHTPRHSLLGRRFSMAQG